jgi:hypothetical protein
MIDPIDLTIDLSVKRAALERLRNVDLEWSTARSDAINVIFRDLRDSIAAMLAHFERCDADTTWGPVVARSPEEQLLFTVKVAARILNGKYTVNELLVTHQVLDDMHGAYSDTTVA